MCIIVGFEILSCRSGSSSVTSVGVGYGEENNEARTLIEPEKGVWLVPKEIAFPM